MADDSLTEEILFSLVQTFYPLPCASKWPLASDDSGSTSDEAAQTPHVNTKKLKKTKGRTPSHVAKRVCCVEEKQLLLKELAFLEAKAALLRQETGIPDPKEVAATEQQVETNRQLKETIALQQNAVATAQSAFAEFSALRGHNPLETYIHLGMDSATRRSEVCALKHEHLQRAKEFLKQRMQLVANPERPFHEESGHLTDEGHYIATKLDVHQFVGVQSLKQVFDAMQFYFLNLEITTTELGTDLTVREDSNDLEAGVQKNPMLHHRLVTMLSNGPLVEKNAIKFFQYYDDEEDEGGPCGIMAAAPVDEDDLYPYNSAERLRKDISAAMKLSSFFRKKKVPGETAEDEIVVVLTRWFRVKLHHSELKFPPHVLEEVQRSVTRFTDHMVHSMNQTLYGAP